MAQSIEAGALGVSPQAVLDNTISAGGATGSSATAATVQLVAATGALGQLDGSSAANPGVVRTEASAAEEQLVPAMPEALPGEFVPCPRCNQRRARWETMRNQIESMFFLNGCLMWFPTISQVKIWFIIQLISNDFNESGCFGYQVGRCKCFVPKFLPM